MNTFLPSPDFAVCAKVLDPTRLNRQISEVNTLARTLWVYERILEVNNRQLPWGVQFPLACNLWVSKCGHVLLRELMEYHRQMNLEFKRHSGKNHDSWSSLNWPSLLKTQPEQPRNVQWLEIVHWSHISKLLGKDPGYYRMAFSRVGITLPAEEWGYVWENPAIVAPTPAR